MTHLYLAPYVGAGADEDPFRPRGSEQPGWSAIDLRADCTILAGRAIMLVPVRDDTIGIYLGDAPDIASAAAKLLIESRFGITLAATRLRQILPELLIAHARDDGTRWRPLRPMLDGVFRVYLDGLWWEAKSLSGGSTITESFNKADSTILGPDLAWTETNQDLEVFSNVCRAVATTGVIGEARTDTALATVDQYAQAVLVLGGTPASEIGGKVCVRFAAAARTHYFYQFAKTATPTYNRGVYKRVAGTATLLAGTTGVSFTDGDTVRVQCNGTTITGHRNGTQEESVTDTAIDGVTVGGKQVGIAAQRLATTLTLDAFEAGDLGDVTLTPGRGALLAAGATAIVVVGTILQAAAGALAVTGLAASLILGTVITPPAGALGLTGAAPTVVGMGDTAITPPAGSLALTAAAPDLMQDARLTPAPGALAFTGAVPTLLEATLVTPSAGALAVSGGTPTVIQGPVVTPSAGSLALSGAAPQLLHEARITPSAGALTVTGAAGSVEVSGGTTRTPGAGALGFAGAAPILEHHTFFDFTRLSIRATLDAPAAAWDLDTPDISLMAGDDAATSVRLAAGFIDGSDVAQLVNQIEAGRVTGRSWAGARPGLSVRLRGLDAMDVLMRTQRAIRYVPAPPPAVLASVAPAEGEPEVETKVGTWTARSIATDLLEGTGLALYWGVRDYTIREEFSGVGAILSLLRQLVAPWDFAPLGVDIRAQASLIRVTQRQLSPVATVSKSMAAGRWDAVQGERQQHPLIGSVVLEGRLESSRLTQSVDADGGIVYLGGDDAENALESRQPLTVRTSQDVRDALGRLISRTERTERWRMPDRLMEWSREKAWQATAATDGVLKQTSDTEVTVSLEASRYGPKGPINQPLPLSSVTTVRTIVVETVRDLMQFFENVGSQSEPLYQWVTHGFDRQVLSLKLTRRQETGYSYDEQRFLREQTNTVYRFLYTPDGSFIIALTERATSTWRDEAPSWIRLTETRATFDAKTGALTGSSTREGAPVAGYPPGGLHPPGQGLTIIYQIGDTVTEAALADAILTPIRLAATISSDPTAIPARYSNRNLDAADLAYQLALLTSCSGVYERPFRFSGPAMPWLSVADALEVTAYTPYAGASPMALGPGLVRELAMSYTRATAELRAEGEAVVYEAP